MFVIASVNNKVNVEMTQLKSESRRNSRSNSVNIRTIYLIPVALQLPSNLLMNKSNHNPFHLDVQCNVQGSLQMLSILHHLS